MDELLKELTPSKPWLKNLKYDDLTEGEKEDLRKLYDLKKQSESGHLSQDQIKSAMLDMILSVANELANTPITVASADSIGLDFQLKARMKNYLLLYGLLGRSDKAKQKLEEAGVKFQQASNQTPVT